MYLISACLCGVNCKYNGANNYNEKCNELFISGKAVLICPEQLGGLTTPRVPSELQANAKDVMEGNGKVITKCGFIVNDELFNLIQKGEINSFSFGGMGKSSTLFEIEGN